MGDLVFLATIDKKVFECLPNSLDIYKKIHLESVDIYASFKSDIKGIINEINKCKLLHNQKNVVTL